MLCLVFPKTVADGRPVNCILTWTCDVWWEKPESAIGNSYSMYLVVLIDSQVDVKGTWQISSAAGSGSQWRTICVFSSPSAAIQSAWGRGCIDNNNKFLHGFVLSGMCIKKEERPTELLTNTSLIHELYIQHDV